MQDRGVSFRNRSSLEKRENEILSVIKIVFLARPKIFGKFIFGNKKGLPRAQKKKMTTPGDGAPSFLAPALTALLSLLAASALTSTLRRASRRRLLLARLPLAPGSLGWLRGHVPLLLAPDFHRSMCRWSDELGGGGVFAVALPFGDRGVVVTDPAAVAAVLGARHGCAGGEEDAAGSKASGGEQLPSYPFEALPKYSPAYGVLDALWGGAPSVFTASGKTARWAAVRKGVAPAFSVAASRGSVGGISRAAAELCDSLLRQGKAVAAATERDVGRKAGEREGAGGAGRRPPAPPTSSTTRSSSSPPLLPLLPLPCRSRSTPTPWACASPSPPSGGGAGSR